MNKTLRRSVVLVQSLLILVLASSRLKADTGACGGVTTTLPFMDVGSSIFFCQIAEAYFSGLTNGTSATAYSPANNVTREQMAAFITRAQDSALRRGSRRAALDQFWTTQGAAGLGLTTVGADPHLVKSDGVDLWVANFEGTVSRVRASDGSVVGTWTGATRASGVLVAMGSVFVTGSTSPGNLYEVNPAAPPGAVTTLSSGLGDSPDGIVFDGASIWTANQGGSLSKITLNPLGPLSVTNVTTGFTQPAGILFDGANIWVTDQGDNKLKQLDGSGSILQSVVVGSLPFLPAFDGTNMWVPNRGDDTVTVVRASGALAGTVLATLSGNGLKYPIQAAFDGQRILVTNLMGGTVSLWRAADLTRLGSISTGLGTFPTGACSDGLNFWITLPGAGKLARL